MTEEKKELEWKNDEVYLYDGKVLKKAGDGWKLFTLMFNVGGVYPFKVSAFDSLGSKETKKGKSLTIKELEEGEYYKISYKVEKEAFEAHGKWHDNRTVYHIELSNEDEQQSFNLKRLHSMAEGNNSTGLRTSTDNQQTPSASISPSEVDDFFKSYKKQQSKLGKERDFNTYHATITFLINKYGKEGLGGVIISSYNLLKGLIKKHSEDLDNSQEGAEVSELSQPISVKDEEQIVE